MTHKSKRDRYLKRKIAEQISDVTVSPTTGVSGEVVSSAMFFPLSPQPASVEPALKPVASGSVNKA